MTTKILVVDDHALFLTGLSAILAECITDADIISSRSANEALALISKTKFDLVVLDLNLPDLNGFELLCSLSKTFPLLPVIILSGSERESDAQAVYEQGAVGFISKTEDNHVVVSAIEHVLEGGLYFPVRIRTGLSTQRVNMPEEKNTNNNAQCALHLTTRQYQLLAYLVKGWTNKEIARELEVTEATVKAHVTAILKALNVKNRASALAAVLQLGLHLPTIP